MPAIHAVAVRQWAWVRRSSGAEGRGGRRLVGGGGAPQPPDCARLRNRGGTPRFPSARYAASSPEGRLRAGEPAEQGEGVHVDRNRPIGVSLLEGDSYQAVGALLHSLLGIRRAQDISKQRLSTLGVKATRAGPPRGGFALAACSVKPSSDAQSGLS